MLAGPLTLALAAPLGGYLSDKIIPAGYQALVTDTGHRLFLFTMLQTLDSLRRRVWRLSLVSLGFGLFQSPNAAGAKCDPCHTNAALPAVS